jgi:hypothetical protein
MASDAVLRILDVERFLAIVALAAKIALGQFAHVHLVGTLGHLEHLIMTSGAFETF